MTKKVLHQEDRAKVTAHVASVINEQRFVFVNSAEVEAHQFVPALDWLNRLERFVNDPEVGVSGDPLVKEYAKAVVTRYFKTYVYPDQYLKLTKVLNATPKPEFKGSKQQRLSQVKQKTAQILKDTL